MGNNLCDFNDFIMDYTECVEGFEQCTNRTFSVADFGARYDYAKTLAPGWGCFMEVNRDLNGTWGLLKMSVPSAQSQQSLLVFEDQVPKADS